MGGGRAPPCGNKLSTGPTAPTPFWTTVCQQDKPPFPCNRGPPPPQTPGSNPPTAPSLSFQRATGGVGSPEGAQTTPIPRTPCSGSPPPPPCSARPLGAGIAAAAFCALLCPQAVSLPKAELGFAAHKPEGGGFAGAPQFLQAQVQARAAAQPAQSPAAGPTGYSAPAPSAPGTVSLSIACGAVVWGRPPPPPHGGEGGRDRKHFRKAGPPSPTPRPQWAEVRARSPVPPQGSF